MKIKLINAYKGCRRVPGIHYVKLLLLIHQHVSSNLPFIL